MNTEQFYGSEEWFRHPLNRNILFTEGAKYVADEAGAYWLLDRIALSEEPRGPFQAWKLTVQANKGILVCEDGNGNCLSKSEPFFTDFPEPGITLWCIEGTILLPSEY